MPLFGKPKVPVKAPGQYAVILSREMCKACGFCLNVCPTDVFEWDKRVNSAGWFPVRVAREEHCVGCMLCFQLCPDFCLTIERKTDPAAVEQVRAAIATWRQENPDAEVLVTE
ncbi:MAG TPA: 4Fe-4S dicluster domain-containing protein [Chloroflexota bacterium]|nr:4Fe-4S dicluster domain-containing protein [Chloroflexota bacterium]